MVCRQFGHLVMGRRTYELLTGDPTVNRADFTSITVLSRTRQLNESGVFTAVSPRAAVAHLENLRVAKALLLGGSEAATSFFECGSNK